MTEARRLLLVRHGLPDYRDGKAMDIWPGPLLSETGRRQAAQAAEVVRPFGPVAVYSSPLVRAVQTAECVGGRIGCVVRCAGDLREWHRTERLYEVSVRLGRWLVRWLRGGEGCAVVVSHASPLLALLRSALYLPHVAWHKPGCPDCLEVSSGDRFEVSMASVFELEFGRCRVAARCLFHPEPRMQHCAWGRPIVRLPRPVLGHGENRVLRRANWLALVGYGGATGQPC